MIAKVVLNNQEFNIDRDFDYVIPQEFEDLNLVGRRVLVPFGQKNSTVEGLVTKIEESSQFKRLKNIKSIIDKTPVCSDELLNLCFWMRDKYFCSFYQVFKLMVPPRTTTKVREWLYLKDEISADERAKLLKGCTLQQEVVSYLENNDNLVEYDEVFENIKKKSLRQSVNALKDKGIIEAGEKISEGIKIKKIRIARLNVEKDEAMEFADMLDAKGASVQARMLLAVCDTDGIPTADLVTNTDGNYSALSGLANKNLIRIESQQVFREAYDENLYKKSTAYRPTDEQSIVIDYLNEKIDKSEHDKILLRGVTGSGKTEVFLQAIDRCIKMGKKAIMLVPEISLTPQMVERFVSRFGKSVAVIHSGLSIGERFDQWGKIKNDEVDVVVGARSAIFAPFDNIGIIILDEEHEGSYKSEISPRYHAREVAIKRAEDNGAVLLLASATPSVESYYRAKIGEYRLFEMHKRYNQMTMPDVKVVDMRGELFDNRNFSVLSYALQGEIRKNLENGEKTILFLNRRGYSTFVSCRKCGAVLNCEQCSIALTYHMKTNDLRCHYCGYTRNNVIQCPECGSKHIKYFGTGTQKIEDELNKIFPGVKVLRMDTDTTSKKGGHEKILRSFGSGEADILLGTQMVTKGLDFPDVTLVGVLAADTILSLDDFRAYERGFSLLTQVCGRAGRGDISGRAIIQTYQPHNSTILYAKEHNYTDFYESEILRRKRLNYPPFCDIICIMVTGIDETKVTIDIKEIGEFVKREMKSDDNLYTILGPVSAPIQKIKGKHRHRILIKCKSSDLITNVLKDIINLHEKLKSGTYLSIDVNPINMY